MLYRTLKRLIELGNVEGLNEKIDIFFAVGKITTEEYNKLVEELNDKLTGCHLDSFLMATDSEESSKQ